MPDASCWTCSNHKNWGHETFLGRCSFPAVNNPTRDKQIPPHIVDKGCKNHSPRPDKAPDLPLP